MKFILLCMAISLAACKVQNTVPVQSVQQDADIVLMAQDGHSGILEYNTMVIKDAKSLKKFYSKINMTRKPGLPVPMVDFSKKMVVILCMGEQKGERIPVLSKSEVSDNEMVINITMPDYPKNKPSEVIFYPFYLYTVPTTTKSVSFQKSGF